MVSKKGCDRARNREEKTSFSPNFATTKNKNNVNSIRLNNSIIDC